MLKIWKQSWKKEDGAGQDSGQDTQPRGLDDDRDLTPSKSSAAPPVLEHDPNGPVSFTALPKAASGAHTTRTHDELESVEDGTQTERPSKRRRTKAPIEEVTLDALSKHLPEVMDVDTESSINIQSHSDAIFAEAKQGNTLAYFETETQKVTMFCDLLTWACGMERDRPYTGIARRRRTALVVVDDMAMATIRASQITEVTKLSIGVYTPAFHSSQMNHWLELVYKDVILVSADHFLESLSTGSLAISQIHYMIIDNIMPLKDITEHPVTKIMKEYYRITDKLSRPKLFGAFVVPSFFLDISILNLEDMLDARLPGITNEMRESLTTLPDKPLELVVFYDPQVKLVETPLQKRLRNHDPRMTVYRKYHRNAKYVLAELGSCACDLVWRRALREIEAVSGNDEPIYEEEDELQAGSDAAIRKAKSNIRDTIKNWRFAMPNLDLSSREFNVTPKFAKLVQILKACEPQGDVFRGVIFVQKRCIAYIITDLLRTLDYHIGFLRLQNVVGHGPSAELSTQCDILDGFKSGLYNLLVVTKYAEDLDIAPATIVIRFDLFDSQVSYALCRSRAKGKECHLVHMAERGSDVHRRALSRFAARDARFELWVQRISNNTGSAIPPFPLRETVDPYRSDSDDEDDDPSNYIKDPTTGGKIYLQDAITVLYRFVSQLKPPHDNQDGTLLGPLFEYEELHGSSFGTSTYICTVLLPPTSPITRVSGSPCSSLAHARRTACYQTCAELFNRGILDYRLFPRPPLPTSRPQRPSYISISAMGEQSDKDDDESDLPMKSKQGQSKSTGARAYPRKHPDFWRASLPIMRGCLYPTVITPVIDPAVIKENGGPYSPMLLLTRLPLPPIQAFKVFFSGLAGKVVFTRAASFEVDEEQMQDLCRYTIRIIRYVTNKPFICAIDEMAYFFAPLPHSLGSTFAQERQFDVNEWDFPDVADLIPWEDVRLAAERSTVALKSQDIWTLTQDTDDAIIQDRWVEFTRRYYCIRMRPDLTPLSKPEDSPREKEFENLAAYCKARRKGFEGLQNLKQPIIEVQRCPPIINNLNPASKPLLSTDAELRHPAKYLIPELCAKCTLPASIYRTANLIPSIMRRLDDLLLIKELNAKYFDHEVSERSLHEAVSAPSAAIEYDYERLELLGDAYLKYLSSIYLFVTFPSTPEGSLHMLRQRIISNKSLLRNANRCGLPQYIQSKPFTLKVWAPPGFQIYRPQKSRDKDPLAEDQDQTLEDGELPVEYKTPELNVQKGRDESVIREDGYGQNPLGSASLKAPVKKLSKKKRQENESNVQWIGDKGVADVAEAIIGAAYITGGREVALKVTKALNIPVPHIDRWTDFGRKALAPPPEVTAKLRRGSIEAVEAIIGHKFNHKHLLAQALTHASIHGNDMTSYERLEFIGDAILDFLVIRHIYDRDSSLSPGALTLLKGAMVSNSALAAVCVWAGLHDHLLFESYTLADNIRQYADNLKAKEQEENILATKEQRSPGQYWADIEPPKALSDVVESILGAVYVSDSFSSVGAEIFFDKVLKPFYDRHITLQTLSHHPTKLLFELFQSQGCQRFEIVKRTIPPTEHNHTAECQVIVHDIVLTSTTDIAGNTAARRASLLALDAIEGDPEFLARTCDCREVIEARKASKRANKKTPRNVEEAEEQVVEDALASDAEA